VVIMANERYFQGLLLMLTVTAACRGDSASSLAGPGPGEETNASIAGQTGDEGGATPWTPGGPSNDTNCPLSSTAEPLDSLDAPSELGFSAADILGFAAGEHETGVHWNARPVVMDFLDYAVQVTPGDLDERLRVTLSPDGSPPRYRARINLAPDAGTPPCKGQLELGVTVELRSDSAALDERWRGTLTATDASEATVLVQAPTWRGRLPRQPERDEAYFPNAQAGSLDVIDANDPGSVLAWIDVLLRFRTDAIDGSVNGWVQTADGGAFLMPQTGALRDSRLVRRDRRRLLRQRLGHRVKGRSGRKA
jgi:hypothetical protein